VVDHHVDRPQVEAGQPVQPSGPNRSNAAPAPSPEHAMRPDDRARMTEDAGAGRSAGANLLSPALTSASAPMLQASRFDQRRRPMCGARFAPTGPDVRHLTSVLGGPGGPPGLLPRPGDHSVRAPPDPIPNSAVKPHRAQGTALLRVGERVVARSSQKSRAHKHADDPPVGCPGSGPARHQSVL
jgi:hypothetical protein